MAASGYSRIRVRVSTVLVTPSPTRTSSLMMIVAASGTPTFASTPTPTPTSTPDTYSWSGLIHGNDSTSRFKLLAVPLDDTGLADSEYEANFFCSQALTDRAGGACVSLVARWDAASTPTRVVGYTPGIGDPSFAFEVGQPFCVRARGRPGCVAMNRVAPNADGGAPSERAGVVLNPATGAGHRRAPPAVQSAAQEV